MPDFKNQHRSKMTDPTRLQKSNLERGMVAKIDYTKTNGEKGDYLVFVLQSIQRLWRNLLVFVN